MEEAKKVKNPKTWMIIGIVFAVISVALGVILAFTYINMPNRDEISAEAYEEAKAEYKEQVAQIRQYYELRLKKNMLNDNSETEQPDMPDVEPEDNSYNTLASIDPAKPAIAKDYIYIPAINKKVKISDTLKSVKYTIFNYGICIWGVAKDAPQDNYSFSYWGGDSSPMVYLTITADEYVNKFLEIDPNDEWNKNIIKTAIIYENHNYLNIDESYEPEKANNMTEEETTWFNATKEAMQRLFKDKKNYEDIE